MIQVSLRALPDTHLEVDGVADDVDLRGLQVVEKVTVVPIEVANGIFILSQSLLHLTLVIDVALLHAEQLIELVSGENSVTDPCDVTQVVFLSLLDAHQHVDVLLVSVPDRVLKDGHVAITQFVILIDKGFLGLLVALVGKLLGLHEA